MTAPQVDIPTPKREQAEEKFLGTLVGVFVNPVPTLSGVVRRRPIANAFIVIIVLSIAEGLVQAVSLDPAAEGGAWVQGITILSAPAFGIGFTALFTGFFWLMSRMLGGRGGYGAMFAGISFASAPSILRSLIGFLAIPLGDGADTLMIGLLPIPLGDDTFTLIATLQIGVGVWMIILAVIAVRECNQFSTGRASAAVLIPIAAFIVFLYAVVVAILVATAIGISGLQP